MKKLLTLAGVVLLTMVSCHHEDDPEPEPKTANRTVLVYIAGENSLSPYLFHKNGRNGNDGELQEMLIGSQQVNIDNLILYVDAAETTPPYLVRYQKGVAVDSVSMEESYACDPNTIYKVLTTTIEKYPAKDYGLVLWGHASGWRIETDSIEYTSVINARQKRAYGIDNSTNAETDRGKWINMSTLARVLKRTSQKLKFIFADCCQFQCIESAYELRNTCDYIIASAAEIPGEGAPYNTMVPAMFSSAETFYKQMVDAYYAQTSYGFKEPLSVIKTSEIENLAIATRNVLQTFVTQNITEESPYLKMDSLIYYQGSNYGTNHYMYDMNDFILRYASSEDYAQWKQVFDKCVIYRTPTFGLDNEWMTNNSNNIDFKSFELNDKRYGGVSMFVPQYPSGYYSKYNTDIKKTGWYYAAGLDALGW